MEVIIDLKYCWRLIFLVNCLIASFILEEKLDEETMKMAREELPSILKDMLTSENFRFQVNDAYFQVDKALAKMKGNYFSHFLC